MINLKPPLKTILLDMDGVLWHSATPLLDVKNLFRRITALGLRAYCVTNNSTRTIAFHLEKLRLLGADLAPSQILTSAEATASFLARKFPEQGRLFVVGEQGLRETLLDQGFHLLSGNEDGPASAVVVGLDRRFSYRDFDLAVKHLLQGAFFIGTNPDPAIPTPEGIAPGAGALIKGIEAAAGKEALVIGKPQQGLFQEALKRANSLPEETLMVGDRLDTDIAGAQQLGLRTALVLSGVTTKDQAQSWEPAPDLIADNALEVIKIIEKAYG